MKVNTTSAPDYAMPVIDQAAQLNLILFPPLFCIIPNALKPDNIR